MSKTIRCLYAGLLLAGFSSMVEAQTPKPAPTMVRMVVTGNNPQGRSYVVSDQRVPAAGNFFQTSTAEPQGMKVGGDARILPSITFNHKLAAGETAVSLFEIPPGGPPKPFWHRTTSVDYLMVVSGNIVLLLDDNVKVTLNPGDLLVQRNTHHAWANASATERAVAWAVNVGLASPGEAQQK